MRNGLIFPELVKQDDGRDVRISAPDFEVVSFVPLLRGGKTLVRSRRFVFLGLKLADRRKKEHL